MSCSTTGHSSPPYAGCAASSRPEGLWRRAGATLPRSSKSGYWSESRAAWLFQRLARPSSGSVARADAALGSHETQRFIAGLRALGFDGPYSGGKHEFMVRGDVVVTIPNPHRSDIGAGLMKRILEQARVSRKEWERV